LRCRNAAKVRRQLIPPVTTRRGWILVSAGTVATVGELGLDAGFDLLTV